MPESRPIAATPGTQTGVRLDDRVDRALATLQRRGRRTIEDRLRKLRLSLLLAAQAGLAATVAWFIAKEVLHNPQSLFAPAVAVGTIASSVGNRFRRTLYLIGGITVGITVADLLVVLIGNGYLRVGLVVAASILLAVVLSGEGGFLAQAGGSAVVIAALAPASTDLAFPRFVDGVVGGAAGIVVSLIVLPLRPIYRIRRAAGPPLMELASQLNRAADALAARDADVAKQALDRLRAVRLDNLEATLAGAAEVVKVSPIRWRQRSLLEGWQHGAGLMMRSLVQSRPLAVSVRMAIRYREPLPDSLHEGVRCLATAVQHVRDGFVPGNQPSSTSRRAALKAASNAEMALKSGLGAAGVSVATQIKIIAVNTLRATGISKAEAERLERSVSTGPDAPPPLSV
ncbi:FUSC family protein [Micromonospora peucetia]|uniref:FUSC family protein n=1 Tax=Micromonospora peucetia TaxID=47871 RepID=UPI00331D332A